MLISAIKTDDYLLSKCHKSTKTMIFILCGYFSVSIASIMWCVCVCACLGEHCTSVCVGVCLLFLYWECYIKEQKAFVALSFYSLIWTTSSLPLLLHVVIVIVDGLCDSVRWWRQWWWFFIRSSLALFLHIISSHKHRQQDGTFSHIFEANITRGST